jgi:hypothetical protein
LPNSKNQPLLGSAANNLWVGRTLSGYLSVELYSIFSSNLYLILELISMYFTGIWEKAKQPWLGGRWNFFIKEAHAINHSNRDIKRATINTASQMNYSLHR